jgi:hypothetical protein
LYAAFKASKLSLELLVLTFGSGVTLPLGGSELGLNVLGLVCNELIRRWPLGDE